MDLYIDRDQLLKIAHYFRRLYPERTDRCLSRLQMMLGSYQVREQHRYRNVPRSPADMVLITYGDSLRDRSDTSRSSLNILHEFCLKRLKGVFTTVHILPFYPYSSDDGFSVIDYREVNASLGNWGDIREFGSDFDLMFDLVLNHVSSQSPWMANYSLGNLPERDYFHEISPDTDLSAVVRPRTSPLLTPFQTLNGVRHLWTTFSADQVDLNWANPNVFFEFLDIILFYISQGARVLRLDAVAFLWKKAGTPCIHLPETHEVVKLLRCILEIVAPDVEIITETNVPHLENISYFGKGDEAHRVYNFSLPPLLLTCLMEEDATLLSDWARQLPNLQSPQCFFNFTSSHDGIGMRPLQGLVDPEVIGRLANNIIAKGGQISYRSGADGSPQPYELNITWYSAVADPQNPGSQESIQKFLTTQYIMLALKGTPAVYIHSLLGTLNDQEGFAKKGVPRALNRKKWDFPEIMKLLRDDTTHHHKVFNTLTRVMRRRGGMEAFHPDASQEILSLGPSLFALRRQSLDGHRKVTCISNMTRNTQTLPIGELGFPPGQETRLKEVISGKTMTLPKRHLRLAPWQTIWLAD